MAAKLTPLTSLKVLQHQIPAHNLTPNTSLQHKPLLIYRQVFPSPTTTATQIETHLTQTAVVQPQWRYTMFPYSHFHSTAHEVLCISSGAAKLCFGHEDNPSRVEEVVGRGDVVVVPAGVAHRLLEDLEGGFEMVGSYPKGVGWDMCYGKKGEEGKVQGIKRLGWFERDPVYGSEGPVLEV
ncbi:hypothetical protein MBLNU230_g5088t1 [Neophaeotheca triangularis]